MHVKQSKLTTTKEFSRNHPLVFKVYLMFIIRWLKFVQKIHWSSQGKLVSSSPLPLIFGGSVCVLSRFSSVWLFVTLQATLAMRFSRQECWNGLPCALLRGILPTQRWNASLMSPDSIPADISPFPPGSLGSSYSGSLPVFLPHMPGGLWL